MINNSIRVVNTTKINNLRQGNIKSKSFIFGQKMKDGYIDDYNNIISKSVGSQSSHRILSVIVFILRV